MWHMIVACSLADQEGKEAQECSLKGRQVEPRLGAAAVVSVGTEFGLSLSTFAACGGHAFERV